MSQIVGRTNTPTGCRACCCANCSPDNKPAQRQWATGINGAQVCAVCAKPALEWVATKIDKKRSTHKDGWTGWQLVPYGTDDMSAIVHPLRPFHPNTPDAPADDVFEQPTPAPRLNDDEPNPVKPWEIADLQKQVNRLKDDIANVNYFGVDTRNAVDRVDTKVIDLGNVVNTTNDKLDGLTDSVGTIAKSLQDDLKRLEQSITRTAPTQIVLGGKRSKPKDLGRIHADLANMIVMADVVGDSGIVYGVGEAGSGKSTASKLIADALGIDLEIAVFHEGMSDMDVLGYKNVNGDYVETAFYRAYTQGKLMAMDEFSRTSAAAGAMVNGMTANGVTGFPNGLATRHDKCRFIAWGNTFGRSAQGLDSIDYIGTSQLDPATLSRMCYIPFNTDWALLGDAYGVTIDADPPRFPPPGPARDLNDPVVQGWGQRVKDIRNVIQDAHIQAAITSRAFINGMKFLMAGIDAGMVYFSTIWGHMDTDAAETVRATLGIDERGEPVTHPFDSTDYISITEHVRIPDGVTCSTCGQHWFYHCIHCHQTHEPASTRSSYTEDPSVLDLYDLKNNNWWSVCGECDGSGGYGSYRKAMTDDEFSDLIKRHWE